MDTPVVVHYHKLKMSFDEYVECIKQDLNNEEFKENPVENTEYWQGEEWQNVLERSYKRNLPKCKTEFD